MGINALQQGQQAQQTTVIQLAPASSSQQQPGQTAAPGTA